MNSFVPSSALPVQSQDSGTIDISKPTAEAA